MSGLLSIFTQSLILGIMVLGVYISYKILDFPDMSADGSFALGGAVIALTLSSNIDPIIGCLIALGCGALAGLVTGVLNVKFKISSLLSGILVMGILYSMNLRIMKASNVALFTYNHLFVKFTNVLIVAIIVVISLKVILDLFLKTNLGYTLKGVGDNEQMIKSLGIDVGKIKILGLMISNSLIALSGALMAQFQGFSDVNMGIGTLVLAIASIIIGESVLKKIKILKSTSKILVGSVIYQFTVFLAMNMGLLATDLKMITSIVIIVFLSTSTVKVNRTNKNVKKGSVVNATN